MILYHVPAISYHTLHAISFIHAINYILICESVHAALMILADINLSLDYTSPALHNTDAQFSL